MLKRLNIVRRSLSTSGMLAPVRAVINEVSSAVCPGLTTTFRNKQVEFKDVDINRIKEFLDTAIPAILGGETMPRTKYVCAMGEAISKASGAVEFAEKVARLNDDGIKEARNIKKAAARKKKRAERRDAIISVNPGLLYEDHPLTGEPVLLSSEETTKVMRTVSRTSSVDAALTDVEECLSRVLAQKERRREANRLRMQRVRKGSTL